MRALNWLRKNWVSLLVVSVASLFIVVGLIGQSFLIKSIADKTGLSYWETLFLLNHFGK